MELYLSSNRNGRVMLHPTMASAQKDAHTTGGRAFVVAGEELRTLDPEPRGKAQKEAAKDAVLKPLLKDAPAPTT